jgi:Flp pilus assembly protein TadB
MSAGMNVGDSLDFILDLLPPDARRDLEPVLSQYKLGAPLNVCLHALGSQQPKWRPICEALIGAILTGGSIRSHLDDLITAVNSNAHFETLKRIRSVAVKASAPLGICFLPAFILLAIVPLVTGLFSSSVF